MSRQISDDIGEKCRNSVFFAKKPTLTKAFWRNIPERFLLYPIGERSLLAAMEILIDELLDLLGVVLDIFAERLVIEGLQLGDDAIDHGR